MRFLAWAAAILGLASCATPVGQIPDSDFNWSTADLPIGYQQAYRNLRDGFQSCDGDIAEGDLYTDIGEGRLVAYINGGLGSGRSDIVVGKVTVKRASDRSTALTIATQKRYGDGKDIHARWRQWALGKRGCS